MAKLKELVLYLIFFTISFNLAYGTITKYELFDNSTGGKTGDVAEYIRIYNGEKLEEIPKPYKYRILVPYLAHLIPFPNQLLEKNFELSPEKKIKFKFGLLNILAISLTALIFFKFLLLLSFSFNESFIGALFFLTSFFIVNFSFLPLVDAWAYLFYLLIIYLSLKEKYFAVILSVIFGLFVKEVVLFALIFPIFSNIGNHKKLKKFVTIFVLGAFVYFFYRFIIFPSELGYNYSIERALGGFRQLIPWNFNFRIIIELFFLYGFLPFFFLLKKEKYVVFKNEAFGIIVLFFIPFLINSNFGRVWFLSFPIVIPHLLFRFKKIDKYWIGK
jgi:hypothetical protein